MKEKQTSIKHQDIEKINTRMLIAVAVASFMIIFSLIASKVLLSQLFYQNRVASAKETALQQLKTDVTSASSLVSSYKSFVNQPNNIIGGGSVGTGQNQGDNAQVILDALPSQYDFPALITSVNKIITSSQVSLSSMGGTDLGIGNTSLSATSSPVPISIEFSVSGSYQNIQTLISNFQHSILPFDFLTEQVSSEQGEVSLTVTAQTYYQPAVGFQITNKTIK